MSTVEIAERKSRLRAIILLILAIALVSVLPMGFGHPATGWREGLWSAIAAASAVNLSPLARYLKPHAPVARLLEDETAREHRRTAIVAAFWMTIAAVFVLGGMTDEGQTGISAYDAVRLIATVAIATGLVAFATLELRAARG